MPYFTDTCSPIVRIAIAMMTEWTMGSMPPGNAAP